MNANRNVLPLLQQAIGLHNAGQLGAAEQHYRAALAIDAGHRDGLHLLALCLHLQGRDAEARDYARRAVDPAGRGAVPAAFHNTLGEVERAGGDGVAAEACFRRALQLDPGNADAQNNLAILLDARGAHDEALQLYESAYARGHSPRVAANLGQALLRAGRVDAAEAIFAALLPALDAPQPENVYRVAVDGLIELRRRPQALRAAERWRQAWPASPAALRAQAAALALLHREAEALPLYQSLLDAGVGGAGLHGDIGRCFHHTGEVEKALAWYGNGLELEPDNVMLRRARAVLWIEEGRVDAGIAELRRLLAEDPEQPARAFDLAFYLLLLGDFAEGWRHYEQRLRLGDSVARAGSRVLPGQAWVGGDCAGQSILVVEEQGVGDSIHFARFLAELDRRGARVVFEARPGMARLAAWLAPFARIVGRGEPLPSVDLHCHVMSLPGLLGLDDAGRLHGAAPFAALQPPAAERQRWAERLAAAGAAGRRIGLCWAGSTIHANDPWRSCAAAAFSIFAGCDGVSFVSLQRERRDEGLPELPGLIDLTPQLADLADTAALIANLDLVICIDSAVAHLAGTLGVPTWLLLTRNGDWRWGREGEATPWYPSLRLFRQTRLGDWEPVLQRLRASLDGTPALPSPAAESRPPPAGAAATPPTAPLAAPLANLAAQYLLEGRDYVLVRARHGYLLANRNDSFVGRSLIEYGEFSEDELALMLRFVPPGGVVVEAGANIGALTLPLARKVGPGGRVVAGEPQRLLFQMLCANLALNEVFNVDARCVAFGAECGEIAIPEMSPAVRENFGGVAAGRGSARVPLTTIDACAPERVDFIKVDVEGMEGEVLAGAAATIARCRPVLYVENDRREQSAALIRRLEAWGYALYWHTPPLYSAGNFFANADNVFGRIVSGNLLCLPREAGLACELRPVAGPDDWGLV